MFKTIFEAQKVCGGSKSGSFWVGGQKYSSGFSEKGSRFLTLTVYNHPNALRYASVEVLSDGYPATNAMGLFSEIQMSYGCFLFMY